MKRPMIAISCSCFATLLALVLLDNHLLQNLIPICIFIALFCSALLRNKRHTIVLTLIFSSVLIVCLCFSLFQYNYAKVTSFDNGNLVKIEAKVNQSPIFNEEYNFYSCQISLKNIDDTKVYGNASVSFYDNDEQLKNLKVGERLTFDATVKEIKSEVKSIERYHKSENQFLYIYNAENLKISPPSSFDIACKIKTLKLSITEKINQSFDSDISGFITSILFSDTSQLDENIYDDFKSTGVLHIMAVSGFHLNIWLLLAFFVLNKLTKSKLIKSSLSLFIIGLIILFAGSSASVTRAGIMMSIVILSKLASRRADTINSMFVAMFLIMILNPYSVTDLSFLFSFISTAAIIIVASKAIMKAEFLLSQIEINRAVKLAAKAAIASVIISICTSMAILPLSLIVFSGFSAINIIANLALTMLFAPLLILSGIFVLTSPFEMLSQVPQFLVDTLSRIILKLIHYLASFDYAYINVGTYETKIILIFYIAFCLIGFVFYFNHRYVSILDRYR